MNNRELHRFFVKYDGDPSANRDKFLGGSDAGTILGYNQYKSAYTLWLEKTGQKEVEDISNNFNVWFGTNAEELIAKRFTMESGIKVQRSNTGYSIKEYPFLIGHIDRKIIGEKAGLECKTTTGWNKTDFENGEIPKTHYAQMQHYLLVTGWNYWYYATSRDNNQFYWMKVERNDDFIDNVLLPAEIEFWKNVTNMTPPKTDGSDSTSDSLNYMQKNAEIKDDVLFLDSSVEDKLNRHDEIERRIEELKEEDNAIKNEIKEMMISYPKASTDFHTISYKPQVRESLDTSLLKKTEPTYYQTLLDKYRKVTTSTPFTIKKNRGEK